MKRLLLMMLAICVLSNCSKEKDEPKHIEITGGAIKHELFADNTLGRESLKFTTTGAWVSTIASATKSEVLTWVSIDPASGDKAGEYAINIKLEPNYSGETRKAEIKISCNGAMITMSVEQKGTTKDGVVPEPQPSGAGLLTNESTKRSVRLTGATHEISDHDIVRMVFEGEMDGVGDQIEKIDFTADFRNPLVGGKLRAGDYRIENYTPRKDLMCYWLKSLLGSYGEAGSVKVALKDGVYTFTMNIYLGTGNTGQYEILNGSFTGIPRFLNQEIRVESITLNENSKTLELGGAFTLEATIFPENATNKNYTWSSSNTAVATVSEAGLVKGVSRGKATIIVTATDGQMGAKCEITVNSAVAVESIKVEPTTLSMLKGETYDGAIAVTVSPENAYNKN